MSLKSTLLWALACITVLGLSVFVLTGVGQNDEVYYIEPGVNLAMGRGFISGTWYHQNPLLPWGCSTPGMPIIYAAWFSLVGFGLIQSKALSLTFHLLGAWMLVRWAKGRMSLSSQSQAAFVIVLTALPVMVWTAASCRLEVFALVFVGWFLTITHPADKIERSSPVSAFLFGVITLLVGLHHAGYFAIAFTISFLARPCRVRFANGLFAAIGMACGMVAMFLFYRYTGSWNAFLASRGSHYNGQEMAWVPKGWRMFAMYADLVALAAFNASLLVAGAIWPQSVIPGIKRAAWLGLAIYFIIPPLINFVGVYYISYGWMVEVPLLILLLPFVDNLMSNIASRMAVAGLSVAAAAYLAAIGLLVRQNMRALQDGESVARALSGVALPDDAVASTPRLYYHLKPKQAVFYVDPQSPYWPDQVRLSVRWIANTKTEATKVANAIGGEWAEVPLTTNTSDLVVLGRVVPMK